MLVLLALHLLPSRYLDTFLGNLVALTFPFIPLLSLPMGSASIVEEKEAGTLQYLFSNPISKSEFFLGRTLGLLISTSAVIILGYGFASIVAFNFRVAGYSTIGGLMLTAGCLNVVMLAVALIISSAVKRKTTAVGIALGVWFAFTSLSISDIAMSTLIQVLPGSISMLPVVLNPVEALQVLAGIQLGGTAQQLGALGLIVIGNLGNKTVETLSISAALWIAIPVMIGFFVFSRKDLT